MNIPKQMSTSACGLTDQRALSARTTTAGQAPIVRIHSGSKKVVFGLNPLLPISTGNEIMIIKSHHERLREICLCKQNCAGVFQQLDDNRIGSGFITKPGYVSSREMGQVIL